MNLEQLSIMVVILGGSQIVAMAANVAIIISVFRRKPPMEAEFVSKLELEKNCGQRHTAVKTDMELQDEFVTRREWRITETERLELSKELTKLGKATAAIATKLGVEIEL